MKYTIDQMVVGQWRTRSNHVSLNVAKAEAKRLALLSLCDTRVVDGNGETVFTHHIREIELFGMEFVMMLGW